MTKLRLLIPLLALLLSACARLDTPTPGDYRAYVELRGGQVPFVLRVSNEGARPQLWLVRDGAAVPATGVQSKQGAISAQLPNGSGSLQATIRRKTLKGEVRITDPQGMTQTLPFAAELNQSWRFVEQAGTDNADVSGYWQLEAISPNHFATPVIMQLSQTHDAIDGQLLPDSGLESGQRLQLYGQVNGDEVYLGGLGQGRALLFKGKVNAQGELQGDLWTNLSTAQPAVARHTTEATLSEETEALRQVALPWAVPTRVIEQPQ